MFWIGFIVGILVFNVLSIAFFMYCCAVTHTSVDDFKNLVEANSTALVNRESRIEVYHNDECLFDAVFEEK